MPTIIKKLFITLCLAVLITPTFCLAAAPPVIKNPFNNMQIPIPGMDSFQDANVKADGTFESTWVAEYIVGIYRYGIGIIALIAMIAIAIGGTLWIVSAGNPSKVNDAKSWISGGIIGLALGLGSYTILAMVNYNLVNFEPLGVIQTTEESDGPYNKAMAFMAYSEKDKGNLEDHLQNVHEIYCPVNSENLSTTSLAYKLSKIKAIANSFNNKMIYRYGSKNGHTEDPDGHKPKQSCPSGTNDNPSTNAKLSNHTKLCYDCSGFASQVLICAGLKETARSTDIIFSLSEGANALASVYPKKDKLTDLCNNQTKEIKIKKITNGQTTATWITLVPGDIIGWLGHALIYLGGGELADSGASGDGRKSNSYDVRNICDFIDKYNINFAANDVSRQNLFIKRVTVDNN